MQTYTATITVTEEPDTDEDPRDGCDCATCQDNIERWLNDEWSYWGVIVTATVSTDVDGHTFTTEEEESLWRVDDIDPTYLDTVAAELRAELVERLRDEYPGITIEEGA